MSNGILPTLALVAVQPAGQGGRGAVSPQLNFSNLTPGQLLEGVIFGKDPQGSLQLQTPLGIIMLKAVPELARMLIQGDKVQLRIDTASQQLSARIVSINNIPVEDITSPPPEAEQPLVQNNQEPPTPVTYNARGAMRANVAEVIPTTEQEQTAPLVTVKATLASSTSQQNEMLQKIIPSQPQLLRQQGENGFHFVLRLILPQQPPQTTSPAQFTQPQNNTQTQPNQQTNTSPQITAEPENISPQQTTTQQATTVKPQTPLQQQQQPGITPQQITQSSQNQPAPHISTSQPSAPTQQTTQPQTPQTAPPNQPQTSSQQPAQNIVTPQVRQIILPAGFIYATLVAAPPTENATTIPVAPPSSEQPHPATPTPHIVQPATATQQPTTPQPATQTTQTNQPAQPQPAQTNIPQQQSANITSQHHTFLVQTPFGTFSPTTPLPANARSGDIVAVNIQPVLEVPENSDVQTPTAARSSGWPALEETTSLLKRADVISSQYVQQRLPMPGPKLLAAAMGFLNSLDNGDVRNWLGDRLLQDLETHGRMNLAERLRGDFSQLQQLWQKAPDNQWQATMLPVIHDDKLDFAKFMIKRSPPSAGSDSGSTRFLIEVDLSHFGPMQFDGFYKYWAGDGRQNRRFDLHIRSNRPLEKEVEGELVRMFNTSMQITGMSGQIGVQTINPFPSVALDESFNRTINQLMK